ncbi:Septal ring factor EnvC, activator of murein hydrolases AmiA and AmiB [Ectothiorhodospira mobilis]|uniref:Septal ring factor EnvC, activator of murein hydrolases AmiA and AmiB n=1 Tax=Ectothiorhodospira mobilis TaxID=195064 RepID=A0A1I4SN13_ECTMO|nr:peptidoglycan DD-metalloendopeptidase family protein [Ectothiorhodospira mobilis]SFM65822.1 Septal ring factor EnvC, activator of murein hydrolases AmiA and AmiB [Ectothiorhodospira mobilis]
MRTAWATLLAALCCAPVWAADEREEAARRLEAVQEAIGRLQSRLEAARGERGRLEAALRASEKDLNRAGQALAQSEAELRKTQQRLEAVRVRADEARVRLQGHREILAALLRSAYQNGRGGPLKVLLQQEDPARLGRMMAYHRHYVHAREARIEATRQALAGLEQARAELQALQARQARQRAERTDRLKALEAARRKRAEAVAALEAEIEAAGERLQGLQAGRKALEELIETLDATLSDIPDRSLMDHPFAQRRGRLPFPTAGEVLRGFDEDGVTDGEHRRRGVILKADPGDPVHAVHPGRVAFADWMRGYGMLVILDHGDGYMTLYGDNETLYHSPGDWVQAGEVIARAAGGGRREGTYFEIRHDGAPVNPLRWCDSKRPMIGFTR